MSHANQLSCFLCKKRTEQWECERIPDLNAAVCDRCATAHSYTAKNTTRVGRPSKTTPSFSIEFEVAATTYSRSSRLNRALLLLKYGYLRTMDDSVDDEYKSPIYSSLRAFYRPLGVMHQLRDLVTSRCGTHLHVTLHRKDELRSIQDVVFAPVLAHLLTHASETEAFWGRTLCKYAGVSNATRYAGFSLWSQHPTLEYRLPRFRTAEQYLNVVRFCLHATAYLEKALTPSPDASRSVAPDVMATQVLTLYQQALAHPITRVPLLTMKGYRTHV